MSNTTDFGEVLVSGVSYGSGIGLENCPTKLTSYLSKVVKGDGLVHRASGMHTIQIHTINLNANIVIEGTLDQNPNSGAWLPVPLTNTFTGNTTTTLVYDFVLPVPHIPSSGKTKDTTQFFIASGQYAWLRANISNMSIGIVDSIKLSF